MEELIGKFQDIFKKSSQFEQQLEDETELFIKKVGDFCKSTAAERTPQQNKKRPKHLSPIVDEEDVTPSNNNNNNTSASTMPSESDESTIRPDVALPPIRAMRTAKLKATSSLKEKRINEKERQPSICKPVVIKVERLSTDSMKNDVENNQNVKNISKSVANTKAQPVKDVASKDSDKHDVSDETSAKKVKLSDSIELVPTVEERVEISDEENAEKMMPPPTMPAPKTRKPRTKQKVAETEEKRPKRSKQIKQESEEPVKRSTRSKQKPKNKVEEPDESEIPRPIVEVKKEKLSTGKAQDDEQQELPAKRITRTKSKDVPDVSKEKVAAATTSPARSEKSVYEDAEASELGAQPVLMLQKLKASEIANPATPPHRGNDTYVQQPGSANATYNIGTAPNSGTPGISDATFDVNPAGSPAVMDGTYVVPNGDNQTPNDGVKQHQKTPNYNESLMTEDNSQGEDSENECLASVKSKMAPKATGKTGPMPGPKSTKGKQNELFNPNIHSPIKRKIEAFEKAAANNVYASPAQLRSKTTSKIPSKYNTPNLNLKPKQSTTAAATTPLQSLNTLQNVKAISSSTSKLAHIQKKQNATGTKSYSLSREPSAEDLRRANANALEEKKKKREEKLRSVQQQKEQIEKEKREQAEKQMREREEKYRKMMEEKEQDLAKKKAERKRIEELKQANFKLQEQARMEMERVEEQKRLEELKRIEREKQEIMKLNAAKDTQNMLQKQMYQQKLLQQQHKIQQEKQQHKVATPTPSASQISKATKPSVFELLHSDDSTDDEANPSKKRPPPPEWSKKPYRNSLVAMQSHVNASVIDAFFSVQPMTPDLREIFPAIDQRRLKRNSSAVWRTPPRYSQIPKY